jgi:hypothetical protein
MNVARSIVFQLPEGTALATHYQIPNFTAVWMGHVDEIHRSVGSYG